MNAFAAAFVAVVTAHDTRRRLQSVTPCGRALPRQRAGGYPQAPPAAANRGARSCTCPDEQGRECFRD